jgi:hypothetical protein
MAKTARERIDADPVASVLYGTLLERFRALRDVEVEEKSTSFHVVHGRAFAGVHPRRAALLVNIVLDHPIQSDRTHRVDQVSAGRWHNEVLLTRIQDLDAEFDDWVREAYALTV